MKLQSNSSLGTLLTLGFCAACLIFTSSFLPFKRLWTLPDVEPFTEWFQINWQGQVVGWSKFQFEETPEFYTVSQKEHFEGRVRGKRMKFLYQYNWFFSKQAPYVLKKGSAYLKEPNLEMLTNFSNKKELTINQVRNNKKSTFVEPAINYNLPSLFKVRRFIESSPQKGHQVVMSKLDAHSLEVSENSYQVIAEPYGRHQRYLLSNTSNHELSNTTGISIDLEGAVLRQSRHRGIELIASSRKPSFNPEMQQDLYTSNGLKVMSQIGELENISQLQLSLATGSMSWLAVHPSAKETDNLITTRRSSKYQASQSEVQGWHFKEVEPQVLSIIPKLDGASSLGKVEQLLRFAHNYLYYKATPTSFDTVEIIANGFGDCTEYTQLLLALLNAEKIPARKVEGYIYLGDDEQRFGGHEWVEVLIDGQWLGIDPTWNLMHTTAGHLPIAIAKEKSASDLAFKVEQIHYK